MNDRTNNVDEMSIEQLRDELLGAWGRLKNVKAVIDGDYDRTKDDSPIRENVAGDVLMVIHRYQLEISKLADKIVAQHRPGVDKWRD